MRILADADQRFGRGELGLERIALGARTQLELGDPWAAARALRGLPVEGVSLEAAVVALDVARALEEDDPCDALEVIDRIRAPAALRARAETLRQHIGSRCPKTP